MGDPLSTTASIIAVIQISGAVLGSCYRYIQGVKEAPKAILNTINEVSSLKNILEDLERVANNSRTANPSGKLQALEALNVPDGPLDSCLSALKDIATQLGPISKSPNSIGKLSWPLKEKTLQRVLSTIEKQKASFILALATDGIETSLTIKESVSDLKKAVHSIREDDYRAEVRRWLSAPDPWVNQNIAHKAHHHGTATWFTQGDVFKKWKSEGSLMWIHGLRSHISFLSFASADLLYG